jgi:hypothetical protein
MRILGIVLLVVGIILLAFGISASRSISSDVSNFFTGQPTDRSIWLLIGGAVSLVVGIILAAIPGRRMRGIQ